MLVSSTWRGFLQSLVELMTSEEVFPSSLIKKLNIKEAVNSFFIMLDNIEADV
jgi:hypothetical protein